MEHTVIIKALFSLGIVFAILFIILQIIKRSARFGSRANGSRGINSLKINNIIYIDKETKVVNIISQNGVNYILAIGKNNMLLLGKSKATEEQGVHDKY